MWSDTQHAFNMLTVMSRKSPGSVLQVYMMCMKIKYQYYGTEKIHINYSHTATGGGKLVNYTSAYKNSILLYEKVLICE